jgi:hypothetical protein
MATLNNFEKWNRAAIVTDIAGEGENFKSVPGDFRIFFSSQLQQALDWAGEQNTLHHSQVFAEDGEAED